MPTSNLFSTRSVSDLVPSNRTPSENTGRYRSLYRIACSVVLCCVWWPTAYAQQNKPSEPETIRLDTKLALLNVGVFDKQNRPVSQLEEADFTVLENGQPQAIAFFKKEDEPISFGLLLDRSQSMGDSNKLDQAKAVALAFLRAGNPRNEAFCIAFNDHVGELSDYTSDYDSIATKLALLKPDGGTALYDALLMGLEKLQKSRYQRRALILISDGSDQHSKGKLKDLLLRAQQLDVQIYAIGFYSPLEAEVYNEDKATIEMVDGTVAANPKFIFRALAEETGAETFFPRSAQELEQTITTIAASLRRQYLLAYYLPEMASPNAYRQIEVKVRNRGLRIQTRRGFLSDEAKDLDKTKPLGRHAAALLGLNLKAPAEIRTENTEAPALYREAFDQPNLPWPQTAESYVAKGKYYVSGDLVLPALPYDYANFEASFSVTFLTPPELSTLDPGKLGMRRESLSVAGLSFRMNPNGFYRLDVAAASNLTQGGMFRLIKVHNGRESELLIWHKDTVIRPFTQFKVKCVGNKIEVYANSLRIGEAKDEIHTSGQLGLSFNGRAAQFDDLLIKRLP